MSHPKPESLPSCGSAQSMIGGIGMHAKLLAVCVLLAAAGLLYTGTFIQLPSPTGIPGMTAQHPRRIVVVGSGLAGTAAALAAAESAGPDVEVVVLEKEARAGGNSMKASSGINALTPDQGDAAEAFREDTLRSGGGLSAPELVDTLVVRALAPPRPACIHKIRHCSLPARLPASLPVSAWLLGRIGPIYPKGMARSRARRATRAASCRRATARRRWGGWSRRASS